MEVRRTCRDKEDPCAEDDVVSTPVKLTSSHTESAQKQQTHTHDGEDAGGSHSSCTQSRGKGAQLLHKLQSTKWRMMYNQT